MTEYALRLRRFLAKEETIVPPYRFGVYDLLVLPPSFPYGGMVRHICIVESDELVHTHEMAIGKRLSYILDTQYARFVYLVLTFS